MVSVREVFQLVGAGELKPWELESGALESFGRGSREEAVEEAVGVRCWGTPAPEDPGGALVEGGFGRTIFSSWLLRTDCWRTCTKWWLEMLYSVCPRESGGRKRSCFWTRKINVHWCPLVEARLRMPLPSSLDYNRWNSLVKILVVPSSAPVALPSSSSSRLSPEHPIRRDTMIVHGKSTAVDRGKLLDIHILLRRCG